MSQYPAPPPAQPHDLPPAARERVGLGLLAALFSIPLGVVVTVVIWKLGYVSGISAFVVAFSAAAIYVKVAGRAPRAGLAPLIVLIIGGVVVCFFALVACDLSQAYSDLGMSSLGQSRVSFIADNMFRGDVISADKKELGYFAVFGVLGVFSTLRRLMSMR